MEKLESPVQVAITSSNTIPSRSLPPTPAHVASPSVMDTSAPLVTSNNEVLDLSLKKSDKAKSKEEAKEDVASHPLAKPSKLFQTFPQVSAAAITGSRVTLPPSFMHSGEGCPPR